MKATEKMTRHTKLIVTARYNIDEVDEINGRTLHAEEMDYTDELIKILKEYGFYDIKLIKEVQDGVGGNQTELEMTIVTGVVETFHDPRLSFSNVNDTVFSLISDFKWGISDMVGNIFLPQDIEIFEFSYEYF